jgi:hypothetical protein
MRPAFQLRPNCHPASASVYHVAMILTVRQCNLISQTAVGSKFPQSITLRVSYLCSGHQHPRSAFSYFYASSRHDWARSDAGCQTSCTRQLYEGFSVFASLAHRGGSKPSILEAYRPRWDADIETVLTTFQELSVCLQRGNAHMLVRRSPLLSMGT